MRKLFTIIMLLGLCLGSQAQSFFNLTSSEVAVDTVLPHFTYSLPLPDHYADSVYTATIEYPEFIDMTPTDIANYHRLSTDVLPSLPAVNQTIVVDRKQGILRVDFCPLVCRGGKYQILVSFKLAVSAKVIVNGSKRQAPGNLKTQTFRKAPGTADRYAAHSVLASGTWAKIQVPATGVYELTADVARRAGFTDLSKVRIYGYGGNLQNEILNGDELTLLDDLKEVPTCTVNGRRLFYAKGPVSWSSNTAARRTRNPYSDYGCYFITTADGDPQTVDSAAFLNSFYPSADDYHTLYENDGYYWTEGGRNLYDPEPINNDATKRIVFTHPAAATSGVLTVTASSARNSRVQVSVNDSIYGTLTPTVTDGEHDHGVEATRSFRMPTLHETDTVKIRVLGGGPVHLDFVSVAWDRPEAAPDLRQTFPAAQYVYNITNQDHHADPQADMVIIIPTSQTLLPQAQRLARFHQQHDSLRVNIVPADELYNEFSSGTPDANAYRRYLKMLYDRADSAADMPKYLVLFGDGVWDNRMRTDECRQLDPNDYLLCYEGENSLNDIHCYVDDGFFCSLDDGEGVNVYRSESSKTDMLDVAVGRFPVTTLQEAKAMVDKTISYVENANAGSWQNVIMFMGDDGNNNLHMRDANEAANMVATAHPDYQIKKVMWDAYNGTTSSVGNRLPDVERIVKRQQQQGALIMDYVGHGAANQISNEMVLTSNDFNAFTNKNLPLWITASCDIMAFDGRTENIGENAVLNPNGGAVAFFGTTRTVYAAYNRAINMAYLRYVLSNDNGRHVTIGEAQRLAKNYMVTSRQDVTDNKLQYTLLGDPAISLNMPKATVVIDSINGQSVTDGRRVNLNAGSVATIAGHVASTGTDRAAMTGFNGVANLQILDSEKLIVCHQNISAQAETAFEFYNRTNSVYNGSDSVVAGRFNISFAVPFDLNYDNGAGLISAYAINSDHTISAHGSSDNIILGGTDVSRDDSIGPKITCYLNSPYFENGGEVNPTPYFVANLSDDDGINATGNGVGHNLELVVDGDATKTYDLNDNFNFEFGSYTSGSTWYSIPALEPGPHSLLFRAWDTKNNASTATLDFNVVKGLTPTIYSVDVSRNPASTSTTFIINHNFTGSQLDVIIDVFDMSGRLLWSHSESGVPENVNYTIDWDLTGPDGGRLQTGVYLYRARVSSDGSASASKAKKLIVINNN